MKFFSKRMASLFMALIAVFSSFSFPAIDAKAATKSCGYIVNVYDGGHNYSGRYQCEYQSDFGNVGVFGKKVKIEFVNYCSGLNKDQVNFYKKYAKFQVWVYSNGVLKKFYDNKKIGDTFKIPKGKNMRVCIASSIDSSGWKQFEKQMKSGLPWTYAQYRLKY